MTATNTGPAALADQLAAPLTVAEPDQVGALCVFPLIAGRAPDLDYLAFAEASRRGAKLTELASGADVNTLLVHNPLDVPVLLYEGEEIQGAQQNRTVDISVLVAAHSKLEVPVSCVEQGRWDHRRHAQPSRPPTTPRTPSCAGSRTSAYASGSPPATSRAPTRARSGRRSPPRRRVTAPARTPARCMTSSSIAAT